MRGLAEVSLPCAHRLGPLFQTVLNDRACSCAQPLALCVAGTWTRQPACKATQQAWAGLLCTPQKLLPTLLLLLLLHRNGGRLIAAHQAVPLTSRGGPQGPAPHSPGAWVWVGFFRRGALPSVCVCSRACACLYVRMPLVCVSCCPSPCQGAPVSVHSILPHCGGPAQPMPPAEKHSNAKGQEYTCTSVCRPMPAHAHRRRMSCWGWLTVLLCWG